MAYAIIQAGGKQFRVTKGETLRVPLLAGKVGSSVQFDALAQDSGDAIAIGTPVLEDIQVTATIVEHGRGPKIIVFKKKRRKQYKKKHGHRQNFTTIRIESIGLAQAEEEVSAPEAVESAAEEAQAVAAAESEEVEEAAEETSSVASSAAEAVEETAAEAEEAIEAAAETEDAADEAQVASGEPEAADSEDGEDKKE